MVTPRGFDWSNISLKKNWHLFIENWHLYSDNLKLFHKFFGYPEMELPISLPKMTMLESPLTTVEASTNKYLHVLFERTLKPRVRRSFTRTHTPMTK